MDPNIDWPYPTSGSAISPFVLGPNERPIRITFHNSSFMGASSEQVRALMLLREFAFLPEIDAIATEPGQQPHLQIGYDEDGMRSIPIRVIGSGSRSRMEAAAIDDLAKWQRVAANLVHETDIASSVSRQAFRDLMVAMAHRILRRDILVTLASHLLDARTTGLLRTTNPRTPREAAQIIGLMLRTRNNYTYHVGNSVRMSYDRGLFYWVLTRHRLPNMWKYLSACSAAEAIRGDDIGHLGQSILVRCVRALEARDAIGAQFYIPQNNNTREAMMYHFNYLSLLLAGAIDAQARVAARVYGITKPTERHVSFRRPEFQATLGMSGAVQLQQLSTDQAFVDLMTLLHELRNTIHGADFPTIALMGSTRSQKSLVKVLPQHAASIWDAAQRQGSIDRWGLRRTADVEFEPYTYALALVESCLRQVDDIARATDVERLLSAGGAAESLLVAPPTDSVFREDVRERLALLG